MTGAKRLVFGREFWDLLWIGMLVVGGERFKVYMRKKEGAEEREGCLVGSSVVWCQGCLENAVRVKATA